MVQPLALVKKEILIHFFKLLFMKLFTIPNLMTLGNLLCGCLGLFFVFEGNLITASYLIFFAGVLDFLDGFVARLLQQHSEIGKQLDSLADMVTFGVLPSIIIVKLIHLSTEYSLPLMPENLKFEHPMPKIAYIGLVIALFSCLRLAKFNIDTRQSTSFIGLPTPANAFVVASFPLILQFNPIYSEGLLNTNLLIAYSLIISYLLIAELPLFALKFKKFDWSSNKIKYLFLLISIFLVLLIQFLAIPIIIFIYIIISVIDNFTKKN